MWVFYVISDSHDCPNQRINYQVIALSTDTFWSRFVDNTRMSDFMDCDSGQSQ